MNLRESVTEEVEQSASSNDEDEEELEQIEVDFDSTPFVNFYPTTLISGTLVEGEGNPIIRFPDASNNGGRRDQGYLGLVMEDLTIDTSDESGFDMSEAFFAKTSDEDSSEYRAVNGNDSQTSFKYDGDQVNISGDKYDIEERTTEIDGRAILVVNRTAAKSVARKLDVNGGTYAGMDEETGQVNGGLIEYSLTGDNGENVDLDGNEVGFNSRYARNPELREELYGAEVGVLVTRRSEVDEDYAERVADPDDDTRDMMWYSVVNQDTEETIQPVTADDGGSEPIGYSFLEARFDSTAGNLPDQDWEFVQEYIEAGAPTDEDTILNNIEDNADDLSDDPNTERMIGLIQNQAGQ